jgi:tetratricopeptide (TPR) repeat protein
MAAPPQSGRLVAQTLPTLLLSLRRVRFSGALQLRRPGETLRFQLGAGRILLAESNRPSATLAAHLLRSGRLDPDAETQLRRHTEARRRREAEAALELRLLAPRELLAALHEHAGARLVDAFAWEDGEFALCPGRSEPGPPGLDPLPLIQRGLAAHWPAERLYAALGTRAGRAARLRVSASRLVTLFHCDAGVERLLASLDGTRSLAQCVHAAASPSALATAWLLDAAGVLAYREAPAPEDAGAPEIEIALEPRDPGEAPAAGGSGPARGAAPEEAEDAGLRGELERLHAGPASPDHYALLGVARDASAMAVRHAYLRAAKRLHPDAVARAGMEELKALANEVFARLSLAHETLADPARRREYDASLAEGRSDDGERLLRAETLYRKAQVLVRAGRFAEAVPLLEPCVALWPEEAAYHAELGWALFKQNPPRLAGAREALERAAALDPRAALPLWRLGLVLAALGEEEGARAARARAERLDPEVARR